MATHPLRILADAGVPITVNSDDPSMFGTTLNREYAIAADLLSLDETGLAGLARAAVDHSFADPSVKTSVVSQIQDVLTSH